MIGLLGGIIAVNQFVYLTCLALQSEQLQPELNTTLGSIWLLNLLLPLI
jgi:hypothetical protein